MASPGARLASWAAAASTSACWVANTRAKVTEPPVGTCVSTLTPLSFRSSGAKLGGAFSTRISRSSFRFSFSKTLAMRHLPPVRGQPSTRVRRRRARRQGFEEADLPGDELRVLGVLGEQGVHQGEGVGVF